VSYYPRSLEKTFKLAQEKKNLDKPENDYYFILLLKREK
jgi:hypothetical protein